MRYAATCLLALLAALPLAAENASDLKPGDVPKDFSDKKPFDLDAGTSAATLKGKGVFFDFFTTRPPTIATPPPPANHAAPPPPPPPPPPVPPPSGPVVVPLSAFVSYDVNASYDYTDASKRIADVSLKPSLLKGWFSKGDPFVGDLVTRRSLMPYLDLRGRQTNAPKDTTDDAKKTFFYGGAGVQVRQEFQHLLNLESYTGTDFEQPTLGVTYYRKVSGSLPKDAPDTNAIQARLTFDVAIPLTATLSRATAFRRKYDQYLHDVAMAGALNQPLPNPPERPTFPFSLSFDVKASRATKGEKKTEHFADIALKIIQPGAKMGYVLRYRTGKDLGFEYDRKLLAGILMRLLN